MTLSSFLRANARLLHELAVVVGDVTDDYDRARRVSVVDDAEYEAVAKAVAAGMAADHSPAADPLGP